MRVVLTFRCRETLTLRVAGVRPTGGGFGALRGPWRALMMRATSNREEYTLGIALGGRIAGPVDASPSVCVWCHIHLIVGGRWM